VRVRLGQHGAGATDFGLLLYDAAGALIFGSGGFSAGSIPNNAISGLGTFATLSQITSANAGTLVANGAISNTKISGLGAFATLSQITAANASTYLASAAIGDAYIANLHGNKIIANTITATQINVSALSALTANLGTITAGKAQSANGRFVVDFDNERLDVFDEIGTLIMRIGKLS